MESRHGPEHPSHVCAHTHSHTLARTPGHRCSGLLGGGPLEIPNLFDQVSLFIVELFVLRPVVLELTEKLDEFGLILQQDVQDRLRLVGVSHKHLGGEQVGER